MSVQAKHAKTEWLPRIEPEAQVRRLGNGGGINPRTGCSAVVLCFEFGQFFFGVSDVGFLADAEFKELLLSA